MKNLTFILTLFIMAFTISCENMDQEMSDDELIQAIIESENRISVAKNDLPKSCLLYTSPSPRDGLLSRMPSSA